MFAIALAGFLGLRFSIESVDFERTPASGRFPVWKDPGPFECREQLPQEFLKRYNMFRRGPQGQRIFHNTSREAKAYFLERIIPSIHYRFTTYGYPSLPDAHAYVDDLMAQGKDPRPIEEGLNTTTFMGHVVVLHSKVIPAFKCVERDIKRDCMVSTELCDKYNSAGECVRKHSEIYKIRQNVSSWRDRDSYLDEEFSNHNFGVAVDLDPALNPCCGYGCQAQWQKHPRCQWKVDHTKRSEIPQCWVDAFKRYGFYWLGEDRDIGDTMHFEFLADPDKIIISP